MKGKTRNAGKAKRRSARIFAKDDLVTVTMAAVEKYVCRVSSLSPHFKTYLPLTSSALSRALSLSLSLVLVFVFFIKITVRTANFVNSRRLMEESVLSSRGRTLLRNLC